MFIEFVHFSLPIPPDFLENNVAIHQQFTSSSSFLNFIIFVLEDSEGFISQFANKHNVYSLPVNLRKPQKILSINFFEWSSLIQFLLTLYICDISDFLLCFLRLYRQRANKITSTVCTGLWLNCPRFPWQRYNQSVDKFSICI